MNEIINLTARELAAKIRGKELSAVKVAEAFLAQIAAQDKEIGAFITVCQESALAEAAEIDAKLARGEEIGILGGVPYAAKDIFATKGIQSTGGSKILQGYKPPADATAITKMRAAGAVLLGKLACDEFAQGGSGEHCAYGVTKNPRTLSRVTGGSSSGSAAAIAARMCAFSLGTDTGGSIRQPAAMCGVTGLKVTYGRVSRAGVFAMASSLDTIGPFAQDAADCALVLQALAGADSADQTTPAVAVPDYQTEMAKVDLSKIKLGVIREGMGTEINPAVRAAVEAAISKLKKAGATVEEVSLPHMRYSVPVYYIITPSEVSANMERFDGVRFGPAVKNPANLADFYRQNRGRGFGEEVQRRIMIGTFTLSAGYYDAFYNQASKVRTLIKRDFDTAFEKYDALVLPTAPSTAWPIGEMKKPIDEYLQDMLTIPANLAGLPGISVPCGADENNLPIGLQFITPQFTEERLLGLAARYEELRD